MTCWCSESLSFAWMNMTRTTPGSPWIWHHCISGKVNVTFSCWFVKSCWFALLLLHRFCQNEKYRGGGPFFIPAKLPPTLSAHFQSCYKLVLYIIWEMNWWATCHETWICLTWIIHIPGMLRHITYIICKSWIQTVFHGLTSCTSLTCYILYIYVFIKTKEAQRKLQLIG